MSVCAISAGRRSAACHFNRFDSFEIEKKNNFFFGFADLAERSLAMSELRVGLSQKVYQTFSRQEVVRSRRFLHSHDSNSDRHTQGWLFGC